MKVLQIIALIGFILLCSFYTNVFWQPSVVKVSTHLQFIPGMSERDFLILNGFSIAEGEKIWGHSADNQQIKAEDENALLQKARKILAVKQEKTGKNWIKIGTKFLLWCVFLTYVFILLRTNRLKHPRLLYFAAVIIFGIFLGADPNPLGTIRDMLLLSGKSGVFFLPRLFAFFIFVGLAIFANKIICGWGCQFGVLQDLLFNLAPYKKLKIPFTVSNSIRGSIFILFVTFALFFGKDLFFEIDPFIIYNPVKLTLVSGVAILFVVLLSIFVYRPWCQIFCLFGFVGWLMEQISHYRMKIDEGQCRHCRLCVDVCPTDAMLTIYERKKWKADCFSCGICQRACPQKAIKYDA